MQFLIFTLSLLLIAMAIPWTFQKLLLRGFKAPLLPITHTPGDDGLSYQNVSIATANGKKLRTWWIPVNLQGPCLIIVHGWGANAELMLPVAEPFVAAGFNVLLLNARGHGSSDVDTFSSLPRFSEDLDACIDWVIDQSGASTDNVAVLGHSLGAAAALLSASRDKRISALISLCAFSHPKTMMQRYLSAHAIPAPLRTLIISQVERTIGYSLNDIAPMNTIRNINCPVLIAHGLADNTVPVDDARLIVSCASPDRVVSPELVLIEDADHDSVDQFSQHSDLLIRFLQRYQSLPVSNASPHSEYHGSEVVV